MNSETVLDCAVFQLSPRRTHCELFVSAGGKTEKVASGLVKPFVAHLTVAEDQAAAPLIKLEADNASHWFSKGTVERFVRFVSTPEVLELVGTFDAEMSQLERARIMYSEGGGGDQAASACENETASTAAADITKRELLRAIDVRLVAVKHDLTMACARASAAGFTLENVSELLLFADLFGAHRLNEACTKFISLCQRHPQLICHQRPESMSHQHGSSSSLPTQLKGFVDTNLRSSSGSDMSIEEQELEPICSNKPITSSISRPQPVDNMSTSPPSQCAAVGIAATSQQPKPNAQHLMERAVDKTKEEPTSSSALPETTQPGGRGSRRLSVQDRISLFESKQKEQITSPVMSGGASRVAGKPELRRLPSDAGKPELRRLPSDASEKSVLRRWSGASDMSIDLTNSGTSCIDRRDSSTPLALSSSTNSYAQTASKAEDVADQLKDTATSLSQFSFNAIPASNPSSSFSLSKDQAGAYPKDRRSAESIVPREDTTTSKTQQVSDMEIDDWGSQAQFAASLAKLQQVGLSDQVASLARSKLVPDSSKLTAMKHQETLGTLFKDVFEEHVQVKDYTILQHSPTVTDGVKYADQKDQVSLCSQLGDEKESDLHVKDQPDLMTTFKTSSTKTKDAGVKTKGILDTDFQIKDCPGTTEGFMPKIDPPLSSLPKRRTLPGKEKEVGRKEVAVLQVTPEAISVEAEDSRPQGTKLHKQAYAQKQTRKLPGRSEGKFLNEKNAALVSLGSEAKEGVEMFDSNSSTNHVLEVRPSKGNQERNDELQMKADELEKLFAAHKLRIHSDQTSSRRSKPIDVKVDDASQAVERRLTEGTPDQLQDKKLLKGTLSNGGEFDAKFRLKMVDNTDYSSNMKQRLDDISSTHELRGKFYTKYMQRRDAKLKEEWGSKRPQKEAKMKAMYDSLERSEAEMKVKHAGATSQQNLDTASQRAEKIKGFSSRSALKTKGQIVENLKGFEEEDLQKQYKSYPCPQDEFSNDALSGSEQTNINKSKKPSSTKLVSASNSRISVGSVPRPSIKGSNSGSIKRRTQPENPLAQSVPNFSYFTKENMKPSSGHLKVTPHTQLLNIAQTKSSIEEMNLVNEEISGRSQSMRKYSANSVELTDLSPLNYDTANNKINLLKISKEQTELAVPNKFRSGSDLRPFLKKGDGMGPGSRLGIAKMKSSMVSEILGSDDESEGLVDLQDNSPGMAQDEVEDSERQSAVGDLGAVDFLVESDGEKTRVSQESGNSSNLGLENGNALMSLNQRDEDLGHISLKFDASAETMLDFPGESPGSWNSHVNNSFSYTQEASDIDASVDSPTGSPPSWTSNHLSQTVETDSARMRKKWGSAQLPVLVPNASQQSRKDVPKGFKRLLKFGRKVKGTEFLVNDWASASTASEVDDDTEDCRDLANRSSDDLRKSRMGYPVPYDGFTESEIYPEQVQTFYNSIPNPPANFKLREEHLSGSSLKAPRSFFSLPSFRSKGSETKLR